MICRSLIAALLLLPWAVSADDQVEDKFWQEVQFSPEDWLDLGELSQASCWTSENHLRGCLWAIERVLKEGESRWTLIWDRRLKQLSFQASGPQGTSPSERIPQITQELFRIKKRWRPQLSDVFLQAFERGQISQARKAKVTARAVTAFLKEAYEDPYARIEALAVLEHRHSNGDQYFFGLGLLLQEVAGGIYVEEVLAEGPASGKPIGIGDRIALMDGQPLPPSLDQLGSLLRGSEGSSVRLTLERQGQQGLEDIVIPRGPVVLPDFEVQKLDLAGGRWLHLRVRSFEYDHLCLRVIEALRASEGHDSVRGVILDLRSNPGGSLDQGVCLAGLFLGGGLNIVTRENLVEGRLRMTMVQEGAFKTDLPTVVLMNQNSASASEIVAGALQDHGRAWLVGERSFGKGTIQGGEAYTGQSFQGRHQLILFRTIKWFYLPSGRTPQYLGVIPDLRVPFRPEWAEEEPWFLREADFHPDPRAQEAEVWVQPRSQEFQKIQDCLNQGGPFAPFYGDFQLRMAAEVLACNTSE